MVVFSATMLNILKLIKVKMEGLPVMNRFKGIGLIVAAVVVASASFFLTSHSQVFAQGSAALSIVPKKNYVVEPGETVDDTLTIRNQDRSAPLHLTLRVVDFSYKDDSGAPKLMLEENAPQTTWSLKPFLKIPETVTIDPNSSQTLDMSLTVPSGHGAGSYYSAIVYSSGSSDGGNVGLSASGVTLVFTNIPGQVDEDLKLEKLGAYRNSTTASTGGEYAYFLNDKPERIAYTLKNNGNVTESPVGTITLRPLFGKETVIQKINPNSQLALIGQTRTFTPCIKLKSEQVDFNGTRSESTACTEPDLWPGYYRVELAAYYGQNGNTTRDLVGKASFWYLPWWFILLSVVVLSFVGYHIWKFIRFIRSKTGKTKLSKRRRK